MIKKFDQILKEIAKKQFDPVYFLSGEEAYFIDKICDTLADNILSPSERDFNQTIVYGREATIPAIIEMALRYPMMAQYNVVIVKEAQEIKKIDELEKYFSHLNPSAILVICYKYKSLDRRTIFCKAVEKNACLFVADKVKENLLQGWIENYLSLKQVKITPKAVMLLIEYIGADLSVIINQLDKLLLIQSDLKTIEPEVIEKHIGISREYSIFELQDAIGNKNHKKIARIYNFLESNPKATPIQLIINILHTFFTKVHVLDNLAGCRDSDNAKMTFAQVAKEIGVSSWYEENFRKAIGNYKGKTTQALMLLQEYDLKSKGVNSQGTAETELTKELIFRLIQL
jgi:DNA polymerase III subunit delta